MNDNVNYVASGGSSEHFGSQVIDQSLFDDAESVKIIDLCLDDNSSNQPTLPKDVGLGIASASGDDSNDEDSDVVLAGETNQPVEHAKNAVLKATVKAKLARMQMKRLPSPQKYAAEMRYARSPAQPGTAEEEEDNDEYEYEYECQDENVNYRHNGDYSRNGGGDDDDDDNGNDKAEGEDKEPSLVDGVQKEVLDMDAGRPVNFTPQVATHEEMKNFNLKNKFTEFAGKKIRIHPEFINHWLKAGKLKKIPRNLDALNGGVTESERAPFLLGQNTDFVPYDETIIPVTIGPIGYKRDKDGHVLAAGYRKKKSGDKQFKHPIVYFYHEDGFVVACKITRAQYIAKKGAIQSGMAEVIGERMATYPSGKNVKCVFARSYSVMRPTLDKENYQRLTLYCDVVSGHFKLFYLSAIGLITFVEPRPKGYIADHCDSPTNDSLQNLGWKTVSDNSKKKNLHPDPNAAHKTYKITTL
ncbi:hypothetical protein FisN_8Lu353 [Fistulifera solaris]|uniref:Uncharacterized protein n=1 Tax=Fistulifera solaris TaxID=1519565 RepID=A0A1Z5JMX7_FISSO|nr:hypothetical protein FisN_8Lu353 [Fistulifera solaris]|eukprot:GAX15357.1 hypothetical protein FisN_8Lu353 [Fistulifera solaris]